MRWTKLKQTIEGGFAASVRDRVRIDVTRYRQAHDAEGRWAIVIDGKEVGGLGCIVADREEHLEWRAAKEQEAVGWDAQVQAHEALSRRAHHTLPMFTSTLFKFINMSFDEALRSSDAVLRALASLDRRIGKRRLGLLAMSRPETELERECLSLRLDAEGLDYDWRDAV